MFSLRSTYATSKGGKTLLVPTPYAVKLALIDACFRMYSGFAAEAEARRIFDLIKAQPVRVRPPAECVVQNTFLRVLHNKTWEAECHTIRESMRPEVDRIFEPAERALKEGANCKEVLAVLVRSLTAAENL